MARITDKMLESRVKALNKLYGFKGRTYVKYKSKVGYRLTGSGFGLSFMYGKVQLSFEDKGSSGIRTIMGMGTKAEIWEGIGFMTEAVRYWKQKGKLK